MLNETPDRAVWLNHLAAFAGRLDPWPWVRLAVSCRSDFVSICLPPALAEGREAGWAVVRHRGFGDATQELTQLDKHLPRLRNFSVAVKEWNDEIVFVRRVIPGAR